MWVFISICCVLCTRRKYFRGSVSSNYVRSVFKAEVDQPVVITASVFIFFTLLICIIESQLHRRAVRNAVAGVRLISCRIWQALFNIAIAPPPATQVPAPVALPPTVRGEVPCW